MTTRLSMSSLAGTARTLVAVGTCERGLHVGDDAGGRSAQRGDLLGDLGVARPWARPSRREGWAARASAPRGPSEPAGGRLARGWGRRGGGDGRGGRTAGLGGSGAVGGGGSAFSGAALVGAGAALRPARPWLPARLAGRRGAWREPAAVRQPLAAPFPPLAPEAVGRVVGEERPPGLVDRVLVLEVLLVQLVHQPLVRAEGTERVVGPGGPGVSHGGNASFVTSTMTVTRDGQEGPENAARHRRSRVPQGSSLAPLRPGRGAASRVRARRDRTQMFTRFRALGPETGRHLSPVGRMAVS